MEVMILKDDDNVCETCGDGLAIDDEDLKDSSEDQD